MSYRETQQESRERYLANYDHQGASRYDAWVTSMTSGDHDACLTDLKSCVSFSENMAVLDAGSGTGALCLALVRISGLRVSALEPCPEMICLLESKPELACVQTIRGFCDHVDDASHFLPNSFDLIVSRQLVNCLYDPLAAFRNWFCWLRPGGQVVVMDGLFDRGDWTGPWEGFVDSLPLAACRTTATVPYLLEQTGFRVCSARPMEATNLLPSTRTRRYLVAATKEQSSP